MFPELTGLLSRLDGIWGSLLRLFISSVLLLARVPLGEALVCREDLSPAPGRAWPSGDCRNGHFTRDVPH